MKENRYGTWEAYCMIEQMFGIPIERLEALEREAQNKAQNKTKVFWLGFDKLGEKELEILATTIGDEIEVVAIEDYRNLADAGNRIAEALADTIVNHGYVAYYLSKLRTNSDLAELALIAPNVVAGEYDFATVKLKEWTLYKKDGDKIYR